MRIKWCYPILNNISIYSRHIFKLSGSTSYQLVLDWTLNFCYSQLVQWIITNYQINLEKLLLMNAYYSNKVGQSCILSEKSSCQWSCSVGLSCQNQLKEVFHLILLSQTTGFLSNLHGTYHIFLYEIISFTLRDLSKM